MADITVILKHPLAPRTRGSAAAATSLHRLLDSHNATLIPLHAGIDASSPLARHYSLRVAGGADTDALLDELRHHDDVDAAFVKPGGETPG